MYRTDVDLLRKTIASKGKTMEELAACMGSDRSTVYRRIDANRLRICDMQNLVELLELSNEEAVAIFLAR